MLIFAMDVDYHPLSPPQILAGYKRLHICGIFVNTTSKCEGANVVKSYYVL